MATVTETIGTTGRDHSTITLWAANHDDDPTYDSGDASVGEMYDDSDFNEDANIDGGGTIGLISIKLTVASAERHDGTANTGVIINRTVQGEATSIIKVVASILSGIITIEWLDITEATASAVDNNKATIYVFDNTETFNVQRCLVHDFELFTDKEAHGIAMFGDSGANNISNCIIYNIDQTYTVAPGPIAGIEFKGGTASAYNCTIHNIDQA